MDMDTLGSIIDKISNGENDAETIASLRQAVQSLQDNLEVAKKEAEASKVDQDRRIEDTGPDGRHVVSNIGHFDGESLREKIAHEVEELKELIHDLPNSALMRRVIEQIQNLEKNTENNVEKAQNEIVEKMTTLSVALDEADTLAKATKTQTRSSGKEILRKIGEIHMRLESYTALTTKTRDAALEAAQQTGSIADSIDRSQSEWEDKWKQFIDDFKDCLIPFPTKQELQDARDALSLALDGLPQFDVAQLSRIETTTTQTNETGVQTLADGTKILTELLKQAGGLEETVLRTGHTLERHMSELSKAKETEVSNNRLIHETRLRDKEEEISRIRNEHKTSLDAIKEQYQGQLKQNQIGRQRKDFNTQLESKERELSSLREANQCRLDAKNQELERLQRDISSNLESNTRAIQQIEQEHTMALAIKDREIELLRNSLTDLRQSVKVRDDLASALKESKASSDSQQQALRDLYEREGTTLRQIGELHLQAAKAAEFSDKNKALEKRLKQQAHQIDELKDEMKAPERSNELSKLFYRLYSEVKDLKIQIMADVEGHEFVDELARVILSVNGSKRFLEFVERVNTSNLYCFTNICFMNEPQPISGRKCPKHNNKCGKVKAELKQSAEGVERIVCFQS